MSSEARQKWRGGNLVPKSDLHQNVKKFQTLSKQKKGGTLQKKRENFKEASSPIWGEYSILLYFLIVISARAAPSPGLISQLWQHLDYTSTDCKYVLAANPVYPIVHKTLLWNRIWLPKILRSPSPRSPSVAWTLDRWPGVRSMCLHRRQIASKLSQFTQKCSRIKAILRPTRKHGKCLGGNFSWISSESSRWLVGLVQWSKRQRVR